MTIPPKAFRARRNPRIPRGESVWDLPYENWNLDCHGCATDCIGQFQGECPFHFPGSPQSTIKFACRTVEEMRVGPRCNIDAGDPCLCPSICPFWVVKAHKEKPRFWRGLLIEDVPDSLCFTFFRRRKTYVPH